MRTQETKPLFDWKDIGQGSIYVLLGTIALGLIIWILWLSITHLGIVWGILKIILWIFLIIAIVIIIIFLILATLKGLGKLGRLGKDEYKWQFPVTLQANTLKKSK